LKSVNTTGRSSAVPLGIFAGNDGETKHYLDIERVMKEELMKTDKAASDYGWLRFSSTQVGC